MSPGDLAAALREAAGDVAAVRAALRGCRSAMRDAGADRMGLADALLPLAEHASAGVRQDVASMLDLFPDPFFEPAFARLSADRNAFVSEEAAAAAQRRAAGRKARAKVADRGQALAGALREVESRFGGEARRAAEKVARLAGSDQASRLRHETARAADAVDRALQALEAELAKGDPSVSALREHAARVRARQDDLVATLASAKKLGDLARPSFAPVRLRAIALAARAALGAEVAIDVPPALALEADEGLLRQAIENLVKNAVEAGGEVRVSAREVAQGAAIELVVEDRGAGMSEEELARLFVPYESKKLGGTGVGVPLAKEIVEQVHRGELAVTSVKGEGTRVVVRLPVKPRA